MKSVLGPTGIVKAFHPLQQSLRWVSDCGYMFCPILNKQPRHQFWSFMRTSVLRRWAR